MSTIYPEGTFKEISAEIVIASTMYAHNKLEVNFDELGKTRTFFYKKLKDTQTNGCVEWDSEGIKRLKRENNIFYIGNNSVNCSDFGKIENILSYCDINELNFVFELKDKISKKLKSKEFDNEMLVQ